MRPKVDDFSRRGVMYLDVEIVMLCGGEGVSRLDFHLNSACKKTRDKIPPPKRPERVFLRNDLERFRIPDSLLIKFSTLVRCVRRSEIAGTTW